MVLRGGIGVRHFAVRRSRLLTGKDGARMKWLFIILAIWVLSAGSKTNERKAEGARHGKD